MPRFVSSGAARLFKVAAVEAEVKPEPSDEERRAILAALESLESGDAPEPAFWVEEEEP
jgi:hypothetical protein